MHAPHQIILFRGDPGKEKSQGKLQHIRRSALYGGVEPSRKGFRGRGNPPAPSQGAKLRRGGNPFSLVPCGDARIGLEKALSKIPGLLFGHGNAESSLGVASQPRSSHGVDKAEVHRLGKLSFSGEHLFRSFLRKKRRREEMEVRSFPVGSDHP